MPTVIIAADLCPIERNQPLFERGDAEGLLGDLLPEFRQADLVLANLECPLIASPAPILKSGPVFGAPEGCVNGIRASGIHVLGLANNHILDHGEQGLLNTMNVCQREGLATVGAGRTLTDARQMLIRDVVGIRVGILAVAEHEYSVATRSTAGANPFNLPTVVQIMKQERARYDYLIVLLHGGHEHYALPSPRIKEICRFLADMGANLVVVQHPHRLCGYEKYGAATLVYGQGALLLDEVIFQDLAPFHEGVLVKLELSAHRSAEVTLIPFTQSDPQPGARRMEASRAGKLLDALEKKSVAIQDDEFLHTEWKAFCLKQRNTYLSALLGHGRVLEKLNARGHVVRWLYRRRKVRGALHVTSCETHREILETLFREGMV